MCCILAQHSICSQRSDGGFQAPCPFSHHLDRAAGTIVDRFVGAELIAGLDDRDGSIHSECITIDNPSLLRELLRERLLIEVQSLQASGAFRSDANHRSTACDSYDRRTKGIIILRCEWCNANTNQTCRQRNPVRFSRIRAMVAA